MPLRTLATWPHGAVMTDAQHTRFALWAPDAYYVSVEVEGLRSVAMLPQDNGWFVVQVSCPAGSRYRYHIDGDQRVPDPASRWQAEDVHGASVVVDPTAYQWQHHAWAGRPWHTAVIYEVHVGLLGGYAEVEKHLPRLKDLGITALELMPLAQFPGERNWGYDGVLPYAPHNTYGSPEQLKHLIDTAHGLGLCVMLDVVYNHFGPDGNYLHLYAENFFCPQRHTPWGAGIDFERREVRNFFIENALMWLLEYRFDGLRLDAVHAIDHPAFLLELARRVRQQTGPQRHVWLVLENEFNQARLLQQGFDAQWNDDGHNALHVLLTGETCGYYADFADSPTVKLARALAEGFVFQGDIDRHGRPRGEPSSHLPPGAFVWFLQNHDQVGNRALGERLHQLCSPQALHAATALLLLSPMIPLVWMGDESASDTPFLFFTDHQGDVAEAVREGRRNEFADFPAFADAENRQHIPDPNAVATFHRSRPTFAQNATTEIYRQLLHLRHTRITAHLPGSHALGAEVLGDGAVSARWQLGDGSVLQIDLNLSDQPYERPIAHLLYASQASSERLAPFSTRVGLTPAPLGGTAATLDVHSAEPCIRLTSASGEQP